MNNAEISEAEQAVSDKIAAERASAGVWMQSFVGRIGSRLKTAGAKLQDAASAPASSPAPPERAVTERAEASLDRAGERIGLFAASFSHQVRRSAALVREEAEDVLAEAQSLRRQDR